MLPAVAISDLRGSPSCCRGAASISSVTGGFTRRSRGVAAESRWTAFGRPNQPLTLSWKRKVDDRRAEQPLRMRARVTQRRRPRRRRLPGHRLGTHRGRCRASRATSRWRCRRARGQPGERVDGCRLGRTGAAAAARPAARAGCHRRSRSSSRPRRARLATADRRAARARAGGRSRERRRGRGRRRRRRDCRASDARAGAGGSVRARRRRRRPRIAVDDCVSTEACCRNASRARSP